MTNKEKFYMNEYENLRRKKNKEINDLKLHSSRFVRKTYDLLKSLGFTDTDIRRYYTLKG